MNYTSLINLTNLNKKPRIDAFQVEKVTALLLQKNGKLVSIWTHLGRKLGRKTKAESLDWKEGMDDF